MMFFPIHLYGLFFQPLPESVQKFLDFRLDSRRCRCGTVHHKKRVITELIYHPSDRFFFRCDNRPAHRIECNPFILFERRKLDLFGRLKSGKSVQNCFQRFRYDVVSVYIVCNSFFNLLRHVSSLPSPILCRVPLLRHQTSDP